VLERIRGEKEKRREGDREKWGGQYLLKKKI
jgi:hypothetical protein